MSKALKFAVLGSLLLISAVAVVASPAFATPNITASSGTRAVAPFITPIGDSARSNIIGTSIDSRFTAGAIIRCRTSRIGGFIGATHTQATITSVTFGDGRRGDCDLTSGGFSGVVRNGGTSTGQLDSIDGGATTTRPWFLHVRRFTAADNSSSGTININRFQYTVTIIGVACQITIATQSVDVTYTNRTRVVTVSDASVAFTESTGGGLCPAGGNARFDATYSIRQTITDRESVRVTAAS